MTRRSNQIGNVFLELGFQPEEAAVLTMRADLMADLREFIRESALTQVQAARLLGVTQSRVSDLVRGKWEKFSLEMLITLAARMGRKVELRYRATRRSPAARSSVVPRRRSDPRSS
jgi:predicted XRE-type DNA-binding protein